MRCPVCELDAFDRISEVFDDRYGEPNQYQLVRCKGCGHLATSPRLKEAELPRLYSTFYPRKQLKAADVADQAGKVQGTVSRLFRWINGVDNQGQYSVRCGEKMLDVGCGNGVSLLEARALGASAYGIEADLNVKPIAAALGLNVHFGTIQDEPFDGQRFDLIVLNQVIEHLPEPDISLCALRKRLSQDGRMVLVFPNVASLWRRISGGHWINWHIPYHLHHFDRMHFEQMLVHCGLEITSSRTITPNVWTVLQLRAFFYKPRLGEPNPAWGVKVAPSSVLESPQKLGLTRRALKISLFIIIFVINRSIDALGMGDSLMVEVRRGRD